jgi:hypothetical protein
VAVQHQQANAHSLIGSCGLSDSGGFKSFSSFLDSRAFVNYLERLQAAGETPNHYECVDADTPSKFYVDIDYTVGGRDDGEFGERFQHCQIVLRGFLELVLLLPAESIAFQVATAHERCRSRSFKYSAHVCLQGFYLEDSSARRELKKALAHFLEKPPEALRRSCEFLFYGGNKGGVLVEGCLVDTAVYSCFQNWRTLHSKKKGSGRPLAPAAGSSRNVGDHLIGFYGAAEVGGGYENRQQLSGGLQSTEGAGGVHLSAPRQGINSGGAGDVCGKRPHATASDGCRDGPPAAAIPKGPSRGLCSSGRGHGRGRVHGALWSHHLLLLNSGAGALFSRKCVRLSGL